MWRYIARRLGITVVTVFGIVVVVFFVARVLPGDPAAVRAGPYANEQRLAQVRQMYGLDRPLHEQFVSYLGQVSRGDLGVSTRTGRPVLTELLERLPASLELGLYAVLLACLLGIPLGIAAAARRGTWLDGLARGFAIIGSSLALFWLGLLLIYFLFYRLGWFPGPIDRLPVGTSPPRYVTGLYTIDALLAGEPGLAWTSLRYLMLPVLTLGIVLAAPILKMVRASMIDTLQTDYVRTARAVGVPPRQIMLTDGLRNASLPVITAIGIVFGYMLGGNVIVEYLFSWPGVGRYAYQAIQNNDLEALQGFVIMVGVLYVLLNVAIDIAYAYIDPRVRLGGKVGG